MTTLDYTLALRRQVGRARSMRTTAEVELARAERQPMLGDSMPTIRAAYQSVIIDASTAERLAVEMLNRARECGEVA